MPRGKHLSSIEQQRILDLVEAGMCQQQIGDKLNRSQSVVSKFLKQGAENYGIKKRSGRPKKILDTIKRAVLREISSTGISSNKAVQRFNLNCSSRLVRKWLQSSDNHRYEKIKTEPPLKDHHKIARLQYAENFVQKPEIWYHVIFSDEKKFNLDGPDGLKYYWHDLRKDPKIFSKRTSGGGSVMIWAAFKGTMKSEIAFLNGRLKASDYQNIMEDYLLPFITLTDDRNFIFQQDNAPIHNAATTRSWFHEFGIPLINWPALSPDLNPIENLWGILTKDVYNQEKPEIQTIDELKARILTSWNGISNETLRSLLDSIPRRLLAVIKNNGGKTKY